MNQTLFAVVMDPRVHWRFDPKGQDTSHSARPDRAQIKKQSTKVALILGSPHPVMAAVLTDAPTRAADSIRFLAPRLILLSGFTRSLEGFLDPNHRLPIARAMWGLGRPHSDECPVTCVTEQAPLRSC